MYYSIIVSSLNSKRVLNFYHNNLYVCYVTTSPKNVRLKKHPNKTTFSKDESNVSGVVFSYNLSKYVIFYKGVW